MSQPGFFDLQHRYEGLDAKRDPLVAILAAVPFELFRIKLKTALIRGGLRRSDDDRKSGAGRKPWDEVLIFKVMVLQALYNLSDDQMEYQLRDRLSFMRFVGLGLEDTASIASGEMTTRLPGFRFSWVAMSASSKKYRLAWAQQAAWVIAPSARPGS